VLPPEEEAVAEEVASRASPPEEAVVGVAAVSRASRPEEEAAAGPPAWPREVAAAERAAAVGAQHAAAGVALPAVAEPEEVAAVQRVWLQEAVAEESPASRAAVRPSAAASVCHQDRPLPWPARPPSARLARAIRSLRSASL
jgi:hypothetical protein